MDLCESIGYNFTPRAIIAFMKAYEENCLSRCA